MSKFVTALCNQYALEHLSESEYEKFQKKAKANRLAIVERNCPKYVEAFKKKYANELKDLVARASRHEILFCAVVWSGNSGGVPLFTSFDLDEALKMACEHGWFNAYPDLTRIEYQVIGFHDGYYPKRIGYLGFPHKN